MRTLRRYVWEAQAELGLARASVSTAVDKAHARKRVRWLEKRISGLEEEIARLTAGSVEEGVLT